MVPVRASRWWGEATRLLQLVRARLRGRDLALIAAGLTFYAGLAVVPLLVVAVALTARLTSGETVTRLGERLGELLPDAAGAPAPRERPRDARGPPSPLGGPPPPPPPSPS